MYNESTTIVDVVTLGEGNYALSMKAEDLWVAFEVVRRHIDADGARHYSQMVEAKITSDGYSFKFDTGDVYTCASHDEYPTSETMSDESGGGSGGGSDVEVVRFDLQIVFGGEPTVECDHTVAEIDAARTAGKLIIGLFGEEPEQMAVVSYSGEEDYPYSAVFYSHEVASGTLTVVQTGFYYEEGAWVYAQSSIELTGTGS